MNNLDPATAAELQRRIEARILAQRLGSQALRRAEVRRRVAVDSSPEYGPALDTVCWHQITAKNCPEGRILSVLNFELSEDVDVSDGATAPGKLFKVSMEYVSTISGCVDIKWAREKQNVCVLILWDSPLSWRSFQESVGFTRMAPLVTQNIGSRSMMLPRVQKYWPIKAANFLLRMEITFQADLDSNARLQFESEVSAIVGNVSTGACRELASGWIEHNVALSRLPIDEKSIPARTECTYLMLYEFAEDDDIERNLWELRERLSQVSVSPDVKKKFKISPQMTYQDKHEPTSLEPAPVRPQLGTLAGALQRGIHRSALNEKMEVTSARLTDVRCYPTNPMTVSQGELYMRHNANYMALWSLDRRPNSGLVLPEPYVVDITWLKTRSSLDKIKRRVAKMLNYRTRQLVGYHSGFWVRVADSTHDFAVCTVWESESMRATARAEYCEILERFEAGSSYLDAPSVQQSVPWQRSEAGERVTLDGYSSHVEVITFRLPHDAWRRELFEHAFTSFQRVTWGLGQSHQPPTACTIIGRGGWSPDYSEAQGESDDVFTCFLQWRTAEARVAWYTNLDNSITAYSNIGRCMDELKMFAEGGIDFRLVVQMDDKK